MKMKLSYNARKWLHGLAAAIVSGFGVGLGAFVAGLSLKQFAIMMVVPAATTVGAYLKQFPLPDLQPEQPAAEKKGMTASQ